LTHFPYVLCRTFFANALAELGEFAEAIALGQEAVRLADELDHPFTCIVACTRLGLVYLRRGDLEKAIPLFERAVGQAQHWNIRNLFAWAAPWLGCAYALAGRVVEAVPLAEQGVEQAESMSQFAEQSERIACLSEVYWRAGRMNDALEAAERALTLARGHEERGSEAYVLRLLGEIVAHAEPPAVEQAESYYRRALVLAEELEMRPLVARCHLGLGTLYRNVRDHEKARVQLATAIEMYRSMEMAFWLDRADSEATQLPS
jgi:tetratricopeptide (TPR) repeat protein